ncbi:MAG: nuclear transport factor 2 family protein [Brevundimonas sp.]|uniref:nuclear transport factor 2 family protein n=1 Tax=Brevundimonas sp. TaxID=1871086 RepID=UPI0030028724
MIPDLPKPIADYIDANARLDIEGMLKPFAPYAVVRDDGGRHQGQAAIRTWIEQATIASRAIFTPDTLCHADGQVIVEGPTHGDFPGSPLRFTLRFTLEGDTIRALEISL